MTHIDPGAPNGAGKGESEATSPPPADDKREEKLSGSASAGAHAAGSEETGGARGGESGGAAGSGEFLGVEKDFWRRLLYIIAAGFVAWVSFWFIIILAVAQIIYRLASGHVNEDLRGFTRNMVRYVWDLLSFVTLARDDKPFLFGGNFPDTKSGDF